MAFQYFPGATAVGISFNNGVLLASEQRVSFGNFLVNKNTKKTFVLTENVGAACAGMVADMNVLARQVAALSKIRKMEIRRKVPTNSVAKLMSVIMFERRYFPLLTQVIVGGYDDKPRIYTLDPLGSLLPDEYAAVGSGAEMALGILDAQYNSQMNEDDAKNLAIKSIRAAIQRDASSGDGIDILTISNRGKNEESLKV
ncbi:MAG: proteasome subunit beta [Nitrososphaeraceae archaeon]|jgi:proteasome beta subunit|nr:proteasome subunit beta [Nitrososphaeraceae archaeon]MDW3604427.1 proteasome subunit beta [Nitrososphaeraceae archaeon]MDW3610641.1 proteasome subunit beta [Nitrososphaeraceae archaeon]MDW3630185.1 proteasome subunit beta [Nitrososphaeraceae archaeon]HJY10260.1 proteasome subunit beta [Nitrososphaeraceae archaeon]